tara:strand:- start:199 stop:513 length:315 start_codon:yes stop_codon:yes gene_type:complete
MTITKTQQSKRADFTEDMKRLEVITVGTTPSWKKFGEGSEGIDITACGLNAKKPSSGWVKISAWELAKADPDKKNSRDVSKEVLVSLDLNAAKKLKAMLNELNI